jgi:3-hydroxyacyl-[acyl-carrier-protein] dehydratase
MTESAPAAKLGSADIHRIMQMIPHRYPFLMIDRVVDLVTGVSATGIKNVTINENFFQGHFPSRPVMPGVLIVEAMAQTSGVVVVDSMGADAEGKLVYFMSVDSCRFRRPVEPGDQMHIFVARQHKRGNVWKFGCKVRVDGKVVAEAKVSAMLMPGEAQ